MAAPIPDDAERFLAAFHDVFLALHRRQSKADHELSPEAWAVLEHFAAAGPLTVTEAARHFARSQSATSEILARLRRRGLVHMFRDERDRRRTLVWFTEQGLEQYRQSHRVLDADRVRAALEQLSAARRRALVAALRALATAAVARR